MQQRRLPLAEQHKLDAVKTFAKLKLWQFVAFSLIFTSRFSICLRAPHALRHILVTSNGIKCQSQHWAKCRSMVRLERTGSSTLRDLDICEGYYNGRNEACRLPLCSTYKILCNLVAPAKPVEKAYSVLVEALSKHFSISSQRRWRSWSDVNSTVVFACTGSQ